MQHPGNGRAEEGAEFPQHLKVLRQLGRGAYGTVHLCEDVRSGSQVAVKHVKNAVRHGKSMVREIHLLAGLRHENLLHLIDFCAVARDFDDVFLVLPYMPADLHKVIQSKQALTEKHVQVIMAQILRAMAHLHACGVAHRDLKPANVLISGDCKLKVCDFGLARGDMLEAGDEGEQAGVLTEYVVTRWYRAPEVMLLPKQYTSAVDLWSVGCILGEILGRKALFPGRNHVDMVCRVAKILGSPEDAELGWLPKNSDAYRFLRQVCPRSEGVALGSLYPRASPACLDLLRGLLRWDPQARLTAEIAQEHEYLQAYLPSEAPPPPSQFDWSFDGFRPTAEAVKSRLYAECARYHPEILERDSPPRRPPLAEVQALHGSPARGAQRPDSRCAAPQPAARAAPGAGGRQDVPRMPAGDLGCHVRSSTPPLRPASEASAAGAQQWRALGEAQAVRYASPQKGPPSSGRLAEVRYASPQKGPPSGGRPADVRYESPQKRPPSGGYPSHSPRRSNPLLSNPLLRSDSLRRAPQPAQPAQPTAVLRTRTPGRSVGRSVVPACGAGPLPPRQRAWA